MAGPPEMEALARIGETSIMRSASWLGLTPAVRGNEDRKFVLAPPYTMIYTVMDILANITDTECLTKALQVLLKAATDCMFAPRRTATRRLCERRLSGAHLARTRPIGDRWRRHGNGLGPHR